MQKVLQQPKFALKFLQKQVDQSQEQVELFQLSKISQFKNQLLTLHSICLQFANNLGEQNNQMIIQNGDTDTAILSNQLANYILAISKEAEMRAHNIYEEAIEPVMHFGDNFHSNNSKTLQSFDDLLKELTQERNLMKELKQSYYMSISDNSKQKRPIFEPVINLNLWNKAENSQEIQKKQMYDVQLQKINNLWKNLYNQVPKFYDEIQLNEESRINFTNNSIINFVQVFSHFLKGIPNIEMTLEKLKATIQKKMKEKQTNKETLFVQMLQAFKGEKRPFQTFYQEQVAIKMPQKYLGMRIVHQTKQSDDAFHLVTQHLKLTLQSKNEMNLLQMDELQKKIKNLMITQDQRKYFMNELLLLKKLIELRQDPVEITNFQILHLYKQLFIKLFLSLENELQESGLGFQLSKDYLQFMQILITTFHIKFKPIRSNEFQSIISTISPQCNLFYSMKFWEGFYNILSDNRKWLKNFKSICSLYMKEEITMNSSIYLNENEIDLRSSSHIFKNMITKAGQLISTQKKKLGEKKSQPIEVLQTINMIIIVTCINPEFSAQVIINLAKQQNIKQSDCLQWIEIQEGNQMMKPLNGDFQYQTKQITQKVAKSGSKLNYCLKLCVPYLNFRKDFMQIIQINKYSSQILRKSLIRTNLIYGESNILKVRVMSWRSLLIKKEQNLPELIQNLQYQEKDRHIEHLIEVDVKRSFNTNIQVNKFERDKLIKQIEIHLTDALKAFAYNNPSISYYQGMNMLMGFFVYSCWEDQNIQLAYNLFKGMVDLLLKEIFMHGLKKLRIHFYTLDRLIAIHLPQLFKHWKQNKVECGQYATAWYITLFTYGLQVNNKIQTDGDNKVIFDIMDLIISKGWIGFYQVTLGILSFYKDILLGFDFGQSLNFLNHITKSGFYYYPISDIESEQSSFIDYPPLHSIKTLANSFLITKKNLLEVEKEYYQLREKIDQIIFQE